MKRFLLLCLSLLPIGATGLLAQSECLPQNYSIIFGGGVSLPHVEGNRNDFFSKNGNRVGYDLMKKAATTSRPYLPQDFNMTIYAWHACRIRHICTAYAPTSHTGPCGATGIKDCSSRSASGI